MAPSWTGRKGVILAMEREGMHGPGSLLERKGRLRLGLFLEHERRRGSCSSGLEAWIWTLMGLERRRGLHLLLERKRGRGLSPFHEWERRRGLGPVQELKRRRGLGHLLDRERGRGLCTLLELERESNLDHLLEREGMHGPGPLLERKERLFSTPP